MILLASATSDFGSGLLGTILFLGFLALLVASAVWFFRGPATAADRYVDSLALQLQTPQDAALFRSVYKTKDPKSTTLAWLLTAFLSPTIGYVYQGKWVLAVVSFVTLQGFFVWWFIALFTTPLEVLVRNKRLADEAFNQVLLGRGGGYMQIPQVINVNQYAYVPHPNQTTVAAASEMPHVPPPSAGEQNPQTQPSNAPTAKLIPNDPIGGYPVPQPSPPLQERS